MHRNRSGVGVVSIICAFIVVGSAPEGLATADADSAIPADSTESTRPPTKAFRTGAGFPPVRIPPAIPFP